MDAFAIEPQSPAVFFVRGKHVILDEDVARLFGTETKRLNEQIKRTLLASMTSTFSG